MSVRLHPAARTELIEARNWYESAREGLGEAFASEVERVVALIENRPDRFPFHDGHVRRASLRHFPFSIFFENIDGARYIWAVLHHRRNPSTIPRRRTS